MKTVILDATFRPSAETTVGRMCRIIPELADYEMRKSIEAASAKPDQQNPARCGVPATRQAHDQRGSRPGASDCAARPGSEPDQGRG